MATETCRDFESALRELCRRHRVRLAPSVSGVIGVWNLDPGDAPFDPLADRLDEAPALSRPRERAVASVVSIASRRRHG